MGVQALLSQVEAGEMGDALFAKQERAIAARLDQQAGELRRLEQKKTLDDRYTPATPRGSLEVNVVVVSAGKWWRRFGCEAVS